MAISIQCPALFKEFKVLLEQCDTSTVCRFCLNSLLVKEMLEHECFDWSRQGCPFCKVYVPLKNGYYSNELFEDFYKNHITECWANYCAWTAAEEVSPEAAEIIAEFKQLIAKYETGFSTTDAITKAAMQHFKLFSNSKVDQEKITELRQVIRNLELQNRQLTKDLREEIRRNQEGCRKCDRTDRLEKSFEYLLDRNQDLVLEIKRLKSNAGTDPESSDIPNVNNKRILQ